MDIAAWIIIYKIKSNRSKQVTNCYWKKSSASIVTIVDYISRIIISDYWPSDLIRRIIFNQCWVNDCLNVIVYENYELFIVTHVSKFIIFNIFSLIFFMFISILSPDIGNHVLIEFPRDVIYKMCKLRAELIRFVYRYVSYHKERLIKGLHI